MSEASIGDTFTLASIVLPDGVTLVDELDTPAVSLLAPRLRTEDEEALETETEVVGEGAPAAAADDAGE